ncbi:cupin domain-containing protein [Streptomyces roseolus]|uniref:cupin domain-containing protein n=1 Tax=Streptomyces roseolus TaxID=67358 RepID=UPI003654398C
MTIPYLAQAEEQQQLEWLDGSAFSVLLDKEATEGRLTVGRFDVARGEAPPFHLHTREDEVFMLLKGTALVWAGEEEHELREGGHRLPAAQHPALLPHHLRACRPPDDRHTGRHRGHVPTRRT